MKKDGCVLEIEILDAKEWLCPSSVAEMKLLSNNMVTEEALKKPKKLFERVEV